MTVGGAFVFIALVSRWRGHTVAPLILAVPGALLIVSGLIIPTYLGPVERAWMAFAHAISRITTPILMALVYFVVITPSGLLRKALGGNPLKHRKGQHGFWKEHSSPQRGTGLEKQY